MSVPSPWTPHHASDPSLRRAGDSRYGGEGFVCWIRGAMYPQSVSFALKMPIPVSRSLARLRSSASLISLYHRRALCSHSLPAFQNQHKRRSRGSPRFVEILCSNHSGSRFGTKGLLGHGFPRAFGVFRLQRRSPGRSRVPSLSARLPKAERRTSSRTPSAETPPIPFRRASLVLKRFLTSFSISTGLVQASNPRSPRRSLRSLSSSPQRSRSRLLAQARRDAQHQDRWI